jgi:hypothetical protein
VDSADLHDVQAAHLLRSLRVAAALRIAVVVIMLGAMLVATERYEWFAQSILLACYAVGAITVAVPMFFRIGVTAVDQRLQLITAVGDVTGIAIFEMLSTGRYVPMLVGTTADTGGAGGVGAPRRDGSHQLCGGLCRRFDPRPNHAAQPAVAANHLSLRVLRISLFHGLCRGPSPTASRR